MEPLIELMQLFEKHKKRSETSCSGLLSANDETIFSYGYPGVEYKAQISSERFDASISSIDDAGVAFCYPNSKSETNSKNQLNRFVEWIDSLDNKCPTRDQIELFCSQNNCVPQYW